MYYPNNKAPKIFSVQIHHTRKYLWYLYTDLDSKQ